MWMAMSAVLLLATGAQAQAQVCGTGIVSDFDYPLASWRESCGFDVTCAHAHHMGVDGVPTQGTVVGASVIATCSGVVKQARLSNGYGGIVILECLTEIGCVSSLVGHMDPNQLQVFAGTHVSKGQLIGYIGSRAVNGGYTPHVHLNVRPGFYNSFNYSGCNPTAVWSYAGYPWGCYQRMLSDMAAPDEFIENLSSPPAREPYTFTADAENPVACTDEPQGGANTNWEYGCLNIGTVFHQGATIFDLFRIDEVWVDHRFRVVTFRDGIRQWDWVGAWNRVDPTYGWRHAYFWPALWDATPGDWEFRFYVDTGSGFPSENSPVSAHQFMVLDDGLPYLYDGNIHTCSGPVTGGADTNWLYTCQNRGSVFNVGQDVYTLVRMNQITVNHRYKVEAVQNGSYRWEWTSSWNVVNDMWQYGHFWPALSNASAGQWQFHIYVDTGNGFEYLDSVSFSVI